MQFVCYSFKNKLDHKKKNQNLNEEGFQNDPTKKKLVNKQKI